MDTAGARSDRRASRTTRRKPVQTFASSVGAITCSLRGSEGFRSREKGYRIGYASSDDLVHWTRDDALAGIDVSDDGWDSEMVAYPHVFELDGQIFMAYLGNSVGGDGFGLAVLEGRPD